MKTVEVFEGTDCVRNRMLKVVCPLPTTRGEGRSDGTNVSSQQFSFRRIS